jgi:hypothetical protein
MKVIKGLILFCFLSLGVSACFDAPEFNITPEISFSKIQFKEIPGAATNDSLILYLDFRDGDGDLGYFEGDLEEPYNASFYFLADGTGDTTQVATTQVYDTEDRPYILLKSENKIGKLVTNRTRNEPNYGYLPVYDNTSCLYYADDELLVPAAAADDTYNIADTLFGQGGDMFFLIQGEPLLYKSNVNHNNIDVRFWVFENGSFVEFDWLAEYCFRFDARFPVLTDKTGPLEGTIRYAMPSTGFLSNFSIKTRKLSGKIRDRALNTSNEIFTPQFTLDGIRVN